MAAKRLQFAPLKFESHIDSRNLARTAVRMKVRRMRMKATRKSLQERRIRRPRKTKDQRLERNRSRRVESLRSRRTRRRKQRRRLKVTRTSACKRTRRERKTRSDEKKSEQRRLRRGKHWRRSRQTPERPGYWINYRFRQILSWRQAPIEQVIFLAIFLAGAVTAWQQNPGSCGKGKKNEQIAAWIESLLMCAPVYIACSCSSLVSKHCTHII